MWRMRLCLEAAFVALHARTGRLSAQVNLFIVDVYVCVFSLSESMKKE